MFAACDTGNIQYCMQCGPPGDKAGNSDNNKKNCDDVDYLLIWFSDLVVADGGIGNGRKHRGNRVLITNQVAQELVEDR